ncbi:HNH endonuclease [Anabaena sp. FACHB-1391]|uniref:HNH endonuclease n=1 Tax=Anabaena sp. FACHB-1391 TaxID=2692771 RepID=UPI00167FE7BB|nr:HNH endonuclease [Anabaena sp. FACHB-1391]MBD2270943.1 HNH endonuclease [Anabaena sp. FACHB-1391]
MRPVDKGSAAITYSKYQDAQNDLIERIGDYCSYCERQIETNLAVEHIQPKSKVPTLCNEWSNFLLGCVNCNSCKGDQDIDPDEYFWPDSDNTSLAFDYLAGGLVVTHPALNSINQLIAQRTIETFGLDRDPGNPNKKKCPTPKDKRWQKRNEIWNLAQTQLTRLQSEDTQNIRELIVELAISRGLFSIWMKVFEKDPDMRCRLISGFKGTALDCFDISGLAISRLGGRL